MLWTYEESLNQPRAGLAAATYNAPAPQSGSRIYAIGGMYAIGGAETTGPVTVFATVEAYDTSTKSWSPIKTLNTARGGLAAASGPDGLHALGGVDASGAFLTTHEIYDPATGQWSPAPSMPTARFGFAAATGPGPDGLIYAIGGYSAPQPAGQFLNSVDAYDPATGAWSSTPPMPMQTPRLWPAAVTGLDGLIYAIGGYNSEGPVSTVEAYDPTLDSWFFKPSLPAAGYGLAAAVDPKGLIYAIGGADASNAPQPNVYSYDPARPGLGWPEQDPLLTAQFLLAAATGPDGLIYAIGGANSTTTLGTVEADRPPNPCAAIAAQLETFSEADWENPQAALAGLRGLVSALRECLQQHGGWPVIRG
jgi:hypothetical protein